MEERRETGRPDGREKRMKEKVDERRRDEQR